MDKPMDIVIGGEKILGVSSSPESIVFLKSLGYKDNEITEAFRQEKLKLIREKRQLLLYKTDWTQGKDTPLTAEKVTEFATYRQALRDIPQNMGNPDDIIWPTPPVL